MRATFRLPTWRFSRIATAALIGALVTCVEDQVPTASDAAIADSLAAPAHLSVPIGHTLLTNGTNTVNQKVYSTDAIAPAPNALITVAVMGHRSSGPPSVPTVSGGGMTEWTEVATVTFDGATPLKRLTIFRAMQGSPGSGPLTITFSEAVSHSQWIVSQWDGVDVTGVNGEGAIGQTGSASGEGVNGLTVVLAPFADPSNVAYGAFGVRSSAPDVTEGAGFTEIAEQPSGEGTPSDLQTEWATNDPTIDASWANLSGGALGIEIRAAGEGGGGPGGVSPSQSTVTASVASIAAGGETSTITVTVKDASGAPISGATVVLTASGTDNTITQPAGPTDDTGVATGTISSTRAEDKTVSARANGVAIAQTATVAVTPATVSEGRSTVAASPGTIAPVTGAATVTVTALDAFDNPISGAAVVLAATGSGVLTQPGAPTDASGVAIGTLSAPIEETVTVSATISGTAIAQTATVRVATQTAGEISHTLLTSGNEALNQRVYTSASISPAADALITVAVLMRRSSGALNPTLTGGGMAGWETVASVDFDTQGSPTKRLTLFRAMSAAPGSGPLTITFERTISNVQWIVSQWDGVETSGANGSGAIVQAGTVRSDAATSLAVALAPPGANNVTYGIVGVARNGPTVTPDAGFTEIDEQSSGESSALQAEWATARATVGASWASSTGAALVGVELQAGTATPPAPVASVAVSPPSADLPVGTTLQLTAVPADGAGNPLSGRLVTWGSDAEGVATVDANGLVSAVAVGTATVTATSEGVSGTAVVTVVEPVASVEVTPATTNVEVGGTVALTATLRDAAGNELSGRTVTWDSDAGGVATVDANGLVSAVAAGTVTITATSEGVSGTAVVTVTPAAVAAVEVSPATTNVGVGGSVPLTVTLRDAAGTVLTGRVVTWGSDAEAVATVDADGVVTAVGVGLATITATSEGVNGNAVVTVVEAVVASVDVAPATASLELGAMVTLTATLRDAAGTVLTGRVVTWGSDAEAVAQVDAAGAVTALGTGVATITATSEGVSGMATVTVTSHHGTGTITHELLTVGADPVNQGVYTTAAIAPAPGALVTVAVMGHRSSGAAPSPTLSGGGMAAWTEVASVTLDGVALPLKRLTVFRAMSLSPGSGPITIRFPATQSNSQWIVSQWSGVDVSGVNGAGAIGQIGAANGDATNGLTVVLAALSDPNNVAFGAFGVRTNAAEVTPGAGFAEIAEQPSGEGTPADLQTEWAAGVSTIEAIWANLNGGALGIEIRAGGGGGETVTSVEVSPQSPTVVVGTTLQLTAIALDAGGEPLPGHPFAWASDAPQYASVSASGLVTGVAVGPATISATTDGVVGTSQVTVTATAEPVVSVEVTPGSANLVVGGTAQLTATPKDASGQPLIGRQVTWSTGNGAVATVTTAGLVTGVAEGTATITATSEGQSGSSIITVTAGTQAALVGEWSPVLPAPIVQVHLHLLIDGRVLSFGGSSAIAQVWDPVTGVFTAVPAPALVFCSGHSFLPDGRLLVSGGGTGNGRGHTNSDIFDHAANTWIVGPEMNYARWYPTNTTLPNGEVVTIAGADENGSPVPIPEIWDGTSWRPLTGASLTLPNYPRSFVAPDGRIFVAGPSAQSRWLDVSGTGSWSDGPRMNFGSRSYGSAVMYDAGKIMYVGGNSSPTNTAELIDLNQPSPQWMYTGSLTYARWNLNATALPDGKVLVTGGVSGSRDNPALAVNATELWDPATGAWTLMASSAPLLRGYHSTALLLPDGRVLHSGGGDGGGTIDNENFEIYSPPYLFRGPRPAVTGPTPGTVTHGQQLFVETPDGASIAKVSLIAFGSVTHAIDMSQRLISLSFAPAGGGLSVTLPSSSTIAPPGPYMLFLVNANGVPSIGRIMILQ